MALIERFTPGGNIYPDGSSTFAMLGAFFRRWAENRDDLDNGLRTAWADADQDILVEAKQYTDNKAGGADLPAASDFVNSWWSVPRSIYSDLRETFYQGGVNREGTMQVARFDIRRGTVSRADLGTFEKDDHNVPAFLIEEDKPPLVAIVRHAVEPFVRVRVGKAPHNIESLETAPEVQVAFPAACTYAHLIRRPGTDTVAVLTRNSDGWYVAVSTDWGATWGAARRFHGTAYCTFRLVGNIAKYAITYHPISTPNIAIKYLEIDTSTGDVTDSLGTVVGNLWTGTAVIGVASMTNVVQHYDPDSVRTFDIAPGGSIAAMQLNKDTPELGGTYGVYRYKAGNDWTWEPIVASGVPVGYYQSSYVGGMSFGGSDNSVWLAREDAGTWTLEQWTHNGGAWTLAETIKSSVETKLGRPQIPWGSEGDRLLTAVEYHRYAADTFQDYYGDQLTIRVPQEVVPPASVYGLVNDGSLLLVDAMSWGSGVPSESVPNLAGGADLGITSTLTAVDGVAERTRLGGLHVAVSQTAAGANKMLSFTSEEIRAYMAANTANDYYIGVLAAISRHSTASPPDAGGHKMVGVYGTSNNDTITVRPVTNNKVSVVPSANRTSFVETSSPAPLNTPFVVAGAVSQLPAIGTNPNVIRFGSGSTEASKLTGTSWVLYAAYIEDLTVSGRTYSQAHAGFTNYYAASTVSNDYWTAPDTLAP